MLVAIQIRFEVGTNEV